MSLSPDGALLASTAQRTDVHVWSTDDGVEVMRLEHPDVVNDVAFAYDGHHLVTGCADGALRCWPVGPGHLVETARARMTRELADHERSRYQLDD